MAQTIGIVVETSSDGWATVVAEKGQGCSSCNAVSQCHGGSVSGKGKTSALNRIGARVGDRVIISIDSGTLLSRLAVLYLLPVAMMLTGALVGASMHGGGGVVSNGHGIGYGLAGFVLGFALSVAISRFWSKVRPVTPVISRIVTHRLRSLATAPASGCGCGGR
jgi:sigma-E factor negative regulatory protein RseC